MKVALAGGAYTARSVIADAQRCLNLFPEQLPQASQMPVAFFPPAFAYYPTPGLTALATLPDATTVRGLYRANTGDLYAVCGASVYYISPSWTATLLGTIGAGTTPVSMMDNGTTLLLVDGTANGYTINLATRAFGTVLGGNNNYSTTVSIAANSVTLATGTETFTPVMAGMAITVPGAGPNGSALSTTIAAYVSAIQVTLTLPASTTVNGATETITVSNAGFLGADRVDMIDGFFVANHPGTPGWYSSYENSTTFDPLYFANKNGYSDNLVSLACAQRLVWLIGDVSSEIWQDAGNATFPFSIMQGPFVEHGCAAKYSVATQGGAVFWLSKDRQGTAIAVMTENYNANRVSTHAVEWAWSQYSTISDAIGYTYQQGGHAFYVLTFPTADKTWVYDTITQLWHERAWIDNNGAEHRHRSNCHAFAYGLNVVGDWQNGKLYALDPNAYTDAGQPIKRVRSWPHLVTDGKRVMYSRFQLDIETGTSSGTSNPPQNSLVGANLGLNFGPLAPAGSAPPLVTLDWSDTRGESWGNPISQDMGATGQFGRSIRFNRLGMARDRVFRIATSAPVPFALLGAFIDMTPCGT